MPSGSILLLSDQGPCSLWKADINAAYKRIPLLPAHRQFAQVVYATAKGIMTAMHYSMPFGAISAVHAWNRIGLQRVACCATTCLHRLLA